MLFQKAQDASRATTDRGQALRRDRAADDWSPSSNALTGPFKAYYEGKPVLKHWFAYQDAMYRWAVLGCCGTVSGRRANVKKVYEYLARYVGVTKRPAPVRRPWNALIAARAPNKEIYQWVGFYLLRGRGALLKDVKDASADLD